MGAAREREPGGHHERGPPAGDEPNRDDKLRDLDPREFNLGDLAPPAPAPPPRDFRIVEAHRIGQGGLKEKARVNIAAIRTLRP
jgi:hypothetical protein